MCLVCTENWLLDSLAYHVRLKLEIMESKKLTKNICGYKKSEYWY